MKVEILTRLKNGPEIIDKGTIIEGNEEALPDFVKYELKRDRGTIRVLSESPKTKASKKTKVSKKEPAAKKPAAKKEPAAKPESDEASLRSKLSDM